MRIAAGNIIAQKYRLEAHLARGGMGAVWVAHHVHLGSKLAVKFLDPKLADSPSFVARFEREARAAAAIQSPHVVHVYDFGVDDGVPYIVMELLHGESLGSRLRRMGRLSLPVTAGLLVQLGKGLRRAHEAGIVHRDIKPGNLFLARHDDDEVLKILDFGIAKHADKPLGEFTRTGEIIGSPHYVSPEQARAEKDVDLRSDVWSTGVIAYRMVTGHLPFPGSGLGAVMSKVLVEPPPPVTSLVPELPPSLDDFFARALAKKRQDRYQSVRELVDAFIELARTEALEDSLSPPSWSAIVSVSMPPPESEGGPPLVSASQIKVVPLLGASRKPSAIEPDHVATQPIGTVLGAGAASVRAASMIAASTIAASTVAPSEAVSAASSEAGPAATTPSVPSVPPPSSSSFLTFTPASPSQVPPSVSSHRVRRAVVAAIALFAVAGVALVWWTGPVSESSPASAPVASAPSSLGPRAPAPSADSPRPPPAIAIPPALSPSSSPAPAVKSAVPAGSLLQPPRSASAPAPALPPSGAPSAGPKRKWGF